MCKIEIRYYEYKNRIWSFNRRRIFDIYVSESGGPALAAEVPVAVVEVPVAVVEVPVAAVEVPVAVVEVPVAAVEVPVEIPVEVPAAGLERFFLTES